MGYNYEIVDDSYFGGIDGLKSILNDYYESELSKLEEEEHKKAKRFIEEGLIVGGRRVSVLAGVEKDRFSIDADLLAKLVNSRLIRADHTHLGKSYEVSHDTLIEPIVASYKKRQALEQEEQRKIELKKARRKTLTATGLALAGFLLAGVSVIFYFQAVTSRNDAEQAEKNARFNEQIAKAAQDSTTRLFSEFVEKQEEATLEKYSRHISEGKGFMSSKDFSNAILSFDNAISVYREYKTLNKDTVHVDRIFNSGQEAAVLKNTAENQYGKGDRFNNMIEDGDRLADKGKEYLSGAKIKYEAALALNYDNTLAKNRISVILPKIESAYSEFIRKGDKFFEASGFEEALEQYEKALKLKPGDDKLRSKIGACKKKL